MTNIIILFASISCGFCIGRHLEKREKAKGLFFEHLIKYVSLLKTNIKSRRVELSKFNCEFSLSCSEHFGDYILLAKIPTFIGKNQQQLLLDFSQSLVANNSQELINNLDYYEQLVIAENNSISNSYRNRSVFSKLGVLVGVIVGILFM